MDNMSRLLEMAETQIKLAKGEGKNSLELMFCGPFDTVTDLAFKLSESYQAEIIGDGKTDVTELFVYKLVINF